MRLYTVSDDQVMLSYYYKGEKNFEIRAIFIRYKNTLYDLLNNLDSEFSHWPKLIDKR